MRSSAIIAFVGALCMGLSGCCTSYGKIAVVEEAVGDIPFGTPEVINTVGHALEPLGRVGRTEASFDGGLTEFFIRDGNKSVEVVVNRTDRAIRISWNRLSELSFSEKVEAVLEREFSSVYHTDLVFKDVPCGWLGP